VQLHYDQQHPNRVGKVSRLFLKTGDSLSIEHNKILASYRYTRSGHLYEVVDATDHVVRRFTYTVEGYLNSHQIASGAVREYEWARFAIPENRPTPKRADGSPYQLPPLLEPQPDHEWRITRHWGSDEDMAYAINQRGFTAEFCVLAKAPPACSQGRRRPFD
jgi:hypothetical protein